jgi:hypothetical protein
MELLILLLFVVPVIGLYLCVWAVQLLVRLGRSAWRVCRSASTGAACRHEQGSMVRLRDGCPFRHPSRRQS